MRYLNIFLGEGLYFLCYAWLCGKVLFFIREHTPNTTTIFDMSCQRLASLFSDRGIEKEPLITGLEEET